MSSVPTGPALLPSLSVVIPVYNEAVAISSLIPHLKEHLGGSTWRDPEIILVDDGSTDETPAVLDSEAGGIVRVLHQPNSGRFRARSAGLELATGDYVLFMDARVRIESGLDELVNRVQEGKTVWNAHVHVAHGAGLLGLFWDSPTRIFWHEYFRQPRLVGYGIDEYHRFPKGTTGFLAPRKLLIEAFEAFRSGYEDLHHANDDTSVLQHVARKARIWLSPEFAVQYEPRHSVRRFLPHAFHRGLVFVDGFLRRGNPYAPVIVAFYAATAVALPLSIRRRWIAPGGYAAVTAAAVVAGLFRGLSREHLRALALVTPLFVTAYGAGMWAGLALRLRHRFTA